ncbi:MAG TPA: DUF3276 family protein [Flavobacteriales bacterium]|nr:DUF3276 family protein [Flavobacteriales bacterium]
MMDDVQESKKRDEIFSKAVKAGKRTYFFDVRSTRGNDFYLTLTESKKRFGQDGKFSYEKHKIFLYKEDFEKFVDGLNETIAKIDELKASGFIAPQSENHSDHSSEHTKEFSSVEFEDLGN